MLRSSFFGVAHKRHQARRLMALDISAEKQAKRERSEREIVSRSIKICHISAIILWSNCVLVSHLLTLLLSPPSIDDDENFISRRNPIKFSPQLHFTSLQPRWLVSFSLSASYLSAVRASFRSLKQIQQSCSVVIVCATLHSRDLATRLSGKLFTIFMPACSVRLRALTSLHSPRAALKIEELCLRLPVAMGDNKLVQLLHKLFCFIAVFNKLWKLRLNFLSFLFRTTACRERFSAPNRDSLLVWAQSRRKKKSFPSGTFLPIFLGFVLGLCNKFLSVGGFNVVWWIMRMFKVFFSAFSDAKQLKSFWMFSDVIAGLTQGSASFSRTFFSWRKIVQIFNKLRSYSRHIKRLQRVVNYSDNWWFIGKSSRDDWIELFLPARGGLVDPHD